MAGERGRSLQTQFVLAGSAGARWSASKKKTRKRGGGRKKESGTSPRDLMNNDYVHALEMN